MRPIELRANDDDATIGYRIALSQALHGCKDCPPLSPGESIKYGEAIVRLRAALGKFGDVDAFDDGSLKADSQNAQML